MIPTAEDHWISQIVEQLPLAQHRETQPGDDCAAKFLSKQQHWQLWKTDAVIENQHWFAGTDCELIGRKAVARVLSDFAAMAAEPREFLLTFCLPPSWCEQDAIALARGAGKILREWNSIVVGGETSRVPEGHGAMISIAATGISRERPIFRDGAQLDDAIVVTGKLGGSLAHHHLHFTPRLAEATWLRSHLTLHAMMDLSDGIAKDLPRLARASDCGYALDLEKIPCNENCSLEQALGDGEDYELLFTTPSTALTPAFFTKWERQFPDVPLTVIGKIQDRESFSPNLSGGWDPFAATSP